MRQIDTLAAHLGAVSKESASRCYRIPPLLVLNEVRDEVNLTVDRREKSESPWVFGRIGQDQRTLKPFTTRRMGTMKISLWYGRLYCRSGRYHGGGGVFSKKWWTQKKTKCTSFYFKGGFCQKITSACMGTRSTFWSAILIQESVLKRKHSIILIPYGWGKVGDWVFALQYSFLN